MAATGLAVLTLGPLGWPAPPGPEADVYRPPLAVPEALQPFLDHIDPGRDSFPTEAVAVELEAVLAGFGDALKKDPEGGRAAAQALLAPGFRGAPLQPPARGGRASDAPLELERAEELPQEATLSAEAFAAELERLVAGLRQVAVAEFQVTSIDAKTPGEVKVEVRYDVAGPGRTAHLEQHVGAWRMTWRRGSAGFRVAEWTAASHLVSRAKAPIFTEVTAAALGGNESFRRQMATGLDSWTATIDSALARDSNGHHGVSVGDADGDGLDDLYVAQPAGLPNRLFRARGDGTFEDVTERAGLAVLDDTAQSLFADVDNDGDQDLVLATSTQPLLFANDGSGRFSVVPDAFRFDRPPQGVLTSIAMADYDRDGFLDLYLCVYSYLYGAGEDKAGTPMPYYDARNGPPGVLLRNEGGRRFVETTRQAGLEEGNERYHFAAAWADYDEDGWPDLLVANDFGTKNLYRNRGRSPQDGRVTFEDVAAAAGVLDHGAGMSAAFLDYDNDGRLDIYTGNMWSAAGRRVTEQESFMPGEPPEVRALYRRHARGNSLLRNRGDGAFEDVTLQARAEMGRWAWSSDALDFDSDGFEDLYVANGMLTREPGEGDLEGFFWRQVVARSPRTRVTGTPYDDAWRAINHELVRGSIAGGQRNVFLRNDGRGGFDDVSAAVGLDLDQDGRSFGVLDLDRDGDPDLAVMAARQAPQLRVFRNDFPARGARLALRLTGTSCNRDAVGARVTVETDVLEKTVFVRAGSGFLSQHSKELLVGLGASKAVRRLTVQWPSGDSQAFTDVALGGRYRLEQGGELQALDHAEAAVLPAGTVPAADPPGRSSWLYEPFPAPDFSLQDAGGELRSLSALRGRPAVILLLDRRQSGSRAALKALSEGGDALARAGAGVVALALDGGEAAGRSDAAADPRVPVVVAGEQVGQLYAIVHRHLFMNRQPLPLPTAYLLDAAANIVKTYRERIEVPLILRDMETIEVPAAGRLTRALPFAGTFHSATGRRNYLPYGRELLEQGLEEAAVVAFERAAQASPNASTLYRLGTLLVKSGEPQRAREAFDRALALKPDLAEASNDLGALLAQEGDLPGAIARFRAALTASPEYPDALNNLGYALLLSGGEQEARKLYEKALALQPDFPEAINNLGLLYARSGELERAEPYFKDALARREGYGEAANNLALVLVGGGRTDEAVALLRGFIERNPGFEGAYLTLAKIHLGRENRREGLAVLERLLQRNPAHAQAREILRQFGAGSQK